MAVEAFTIPVEHPHVDSVPAVLHAAEGARREAAVLLAHGAGADMDSEFMVAAATGLAERGFAVLRFCYPYMARARREGRRLPPDRAPVLEAAHTRALEALRKRLPRHRVLLAGKSMGGRMGTHLAAQGADAAGLILFGYPLHPAKRPEKQRSEHFPAIVQPGLFLQGTRDALCDLDRMRRALGTYGGAATLELVDGADHGFAVLKRSGLSTDEVRTDLLDRVVAWYRTAFPE